MPDTFTNPITTSVLISVWALGSLTMVLGLLAALNGREWRVVLPLIIVNGTCLGLVVHGTLGNGM
jgi:fatty acid desaturase